MRRSIRNDVALARQPSRRAFVRLACTLVGLVAAVACSGASESGVHETRGDLPDADRGSSGATSGEVTPGSPHTPATGCKPGFLACSDVCADTKTDPRHCGGCGHDCRNVDGGGPGYGCVDGACVDGGGCSIGISCGGSCVDAREAIDDCGSCQNVCADTQVCHEGACTNTKGSGKSCASPTVLPSDDGSFQVRTGTFTAMHLFSCGPLEPVPTRWFRWTARKSDETTKLRVEVALPTENYVVEVFSAESCDASVRLACNDEASATDLRPETMFAAVAGKTYFFALGRIASTGPTVALHIDD